MATVYLAHDLRHDRPVALKVLRLDQIMHRPHYFTRDRLRIDGRSAQLLGYPPFGRLVTAQ